MDWVDFVATYLYGLKFVAIFTAILLAILSLDDLFIDLLYWGRRVWRALTVYRRHGRADADSVLQAEQCPIVVMIPAWEEADVIGGMIDAAGRSIDYENYHIVVGTYPNDTECQAEVDRLSRRHPMVHKVICSRPGPTSKADCLNNIVARVFELEKNLGVQFQGFVLHDAEDVIPPLELRVFNFLLESKDLIQLPVYPLPRPLHKFTGGHYVDEFAEQHSKDVVIREALANQVPSAGVGTCFSRRAMLSLMRERDAVPFDVQSLTEDYDIAVRLARKGMKEIFVRFPSEKDDGGNELQATVVAVREYFPERFMAAVRQKSRWITGIVFQGFGSLRWDRSFWMNYFLWRDRRGLLAHPVSFLATFLVFNALVLWIYDLVSPEPYRFLSMFAGEPALIALLWLNGVLLLNRVLHRTYFVTSQYGVLQGLASAPRMLWSNVVNFASTCRAAWLFYRATKRDAMVWDKTFHEFPDLPAVGHGSALGEAAVSRGWISEQQLDRALTERHSMERLGQTLLRLEMLTPQQLAELLAEQAGVESEDFDPRTVTEEQRRLLPSGLARKYGIFPLREDADGNLVIGREGALLQMQVRALERRLGRKVRYVVVPQGTVTTALRLFCSDQPGEDSIGLLDAARSSGQLENDEVETLWHRFVHRQVLIGDILLGTHTIQIGALHQALLGYEDSDLPLGRYLIEHGYLSEGVLNAALEVQREFQPTMRQLLLDAGTDVAALTQGGDA